ncbi:hypothetical protein, partial [Citrobacter freundii]|uniref:hypothetical protein n=1 Tax=Citrobacter freundii TaxID=546 RepID=UPI00334C64DC
KTLEKPLYTNHSEYSQYQEYFALLVGDSAQIMKKRVFTQPVPEADFLKILRAQQLGAGHIKYPQNYREYLKFL